MAAGGSEAPAGCVALGEAAGRVAALRREPLKKAQRRICDAIAQGEAQAIRDTMYGRRPLDEAERFLQLDFENSTIDADGGMVSLTVTDTSVSTRALWPWCWLRESDVEKLGNGRHHEAAEVPQMLHLAAASPDDRRRKLGRPPEHDWPEAERQCRRRVVRYGMPEKSSILVGEVDGLFRRLNPDRVPEWRTIERFVARIWPDLEDLAGPCAIVPANNQRRN